MSLSLSPPSSRVPATTAGGDASQFTTGVVGRGRWLHWFGRTSGTSRCAAAGCSAAVIVCERRQRCKQCNTAVAVCASARVHAASSTCGCAASTARFLAPTVSTQQCVVALWRLAKRVMVTYRLLSWTRPQRPGCPTAASGASPTSASAWLAASFASPSSLLFD